MKSTVIRSGALFTVLAMLAGCSSECHCPTCPMAAQTPPSTTTIIHEPPAGTYQ